MLLLFLVSTSLGCNHQTGYVHAANLFTAADQDAVRRVQASVLGKPDFLKSIVAERLNQNSPAVRPCSYTVSKLIRRDLAKTNGAYAEELHVICETSMGDFPLRFEWVIDQNQHLNELKFGYDPDAQDED